MVVPITEILNIEKEANLGHVKRDIDFYLNNRKALNKTVALWCSHSNLQSIG